MIILHQSSALQPLDAVPRQLHLAGVLRLQAQKAGWLTVDRGQVWLTRPGDFIDHVLASGERLYLGRGEQVLAEPWRAGVPAQLCWAAGGGAVAPACPPAPGASQAVAPAARPRGQLAPC